MSNFIRAPSHRLCRYLLNKITSELNENDLGRSAIVFSPHPDDETLGCGGTIIKKKKAGADVNILFMTKGSRSHRHLISETEMKSIRASEAFAASRMLGLKENDVYFLEFKDEELFNNQDSAVHEVREILLSQKPDEIFIPYKREAHSDHLATNRIVLSALQMYKKNAVVYEYPIWLWSYWPWSRVSIGTPKKILSALKESLVSGLSFLRDFRCSVYIGDVLELKRAALDRYRSQMTRLIPDTRWQTLGDISNGEFLECFFQEHEIFHRYSLFEERSHASNY